MQNYERVSIYFNKDDKEEMKFYEQIRKEAFKLKTGKSTFMKLATWRELNK